MVKLENISFSYNKKQEFIKDLSLEFKSGEITTILGPNGSGKSTLLHMMSTYLKPKSGKIYLGDKDLGKLKQKEIAKYISCVYQENEAPDDITVRDLVSFGRNIYSNVKKEDKEENKRMIDFALKATGIEEIQDKKVVNLSGGQKRRVAIAGVIAMEPKVLILDEPTAGLDPKGREDILAQIRLLHKEYGMTIIMVSHSMEDVAKIADRVIVMNSGEIVLDGKIAEVFKEVETLEKIGLAVPQVTYLIRELRNKGFNISEEIFTISQAKEALLEIIRNTN